MIRDFKAGDIGWVISQHGEIYAREYGFNDEFEWDILGKAATLYVNRDDFTRFWMYELDGERAGSIVISRRAPGIAFINFVVVLEEYRGQGIAKELMLRVLEHCREYGFKRIRLETFDCLVTARKLYSDLGFKVVESVASYKRYGPDLKQEFWELDF